MNLLIFEGTHNEETPNEVLIMLWGGYINISRSQVIDDNKIIEEPGQKYNFKALEQLRNNLETKCVLYSIHFGARAALENFGLKYNNGNRSKLSRWKNERKEILKEYFLNDINNIL